MDDAEIRPLDRDDTCRREDVINLYNLILRRDPESESVVDKRSSLPISEVFSKFVSSDEFAATIVRPLAAKNFAAVRYRGSGQLVYLLDWAAGRLPVSAETRDRLAEADNWEDLTLALVRDPAVIRLVPALQEPGIRRTVERRYLLQGRGVGVDTMFVAPAGRCFLSGGISAAEPMRIREISIGLHRDLTLLGTTASVARCRRTEVEKSFPGHRPNLAGFWATAPLSRSVDGGEEVVVSVMADKERQGLASAVAVTDARLLDIALKHLADAQYYGDPTIEAFFQLDNGVGQSLIDLNCEIVAKIVVGGQRLRFGARRARYDGTIIVCLYGRPEFLMLQAALFSKCPGYERYEFIYVSNSPELCDILASDAAIASRIYGVAVTLIVLPGNAGFGAANNTAAAAAETDRLLFVNPDVLPRESEWPRLHAELVQSLPREQVTLFGASLYYDDGSLMHGGMYIDVDNGFSIRDEKMVHRDVLRVEHYGKGAPAESDVYRASRPVPAVTGAFLSIDRAWFEKLNGFSRKYIFGHYEDVDFCLRSLQAGLPAWVHDLPFWHLESKGSTQSQASLGGRLVNRWLMTSTWGELVKNELNGRNPTRFAR
jgi:GT2 family glycosyltransferase